MMVWEAYIQSGTGNAKYSTPDSSRRFPFCETFPLVWVKNFPHFAWLFYALRVLQNCLGNLMLRFV
jgi:hypothetical protein